MIPLTPVGSCQESGGVDLRWLITGGCGFIGINLIHRLLEHPASQIQVLDNLSVGTTEALASVAEYVEGETMQADARVTLTQGDILDVELVNKVCGSADVVVHLAANTGVHQSVMNPGLDCDINVVGTQNMLSAAHKAGCSRFVFASSGAPVGEVEPPIHEELAPHPVSPYGASKLAGEGYCSAYFRTYGLETVALRFGNIYGPRSAHKSSVVAKFITQMINGELLEVYGSGNQTRDFIYIEELVRAVEQAASVPGIGGEIFQIASNRETTVNELVDLLQEVAVGLGVAVPEVFYSDPRLGDVMRNYSDTSKARSRLGWSSSIDLRQGLQSTFEWFLQNRSQ